MNITDTLLRLAQDLRDLIAFIRGVLTEMYEIRDSASTRVTTIINQFIGRPAVQVIFVDQVNGAEANDGKSIDKPRKNLEAVIVEAGISATQVLLLSDYTFTGRPTCNCALEIQGIQRSANGYVLVQRRITFQAQASNSPDPVVGSFPAGIWLGGAAFRTASIDFALPVLPGGQTYTSHFYSSAFTNVSFITGTLTAASAAAGALFEADRASSAVFSTLTLGTNAAGRFLRGVAAGANPNSLFAYRSNVTSA